MESTIRICTYSARCSINQFCYLQFMLTIARLWLAKYGCWLSLSCTLSSAQLKVYWTSALSGFVLVFLPFFLGPLMRYWFWIFSRFTGMCLIKSIFSVRGEHVFLDAQSLVHPTHLILFYYIFSLGFALPRPLSVSFQQIIAYLLIDANERERGARQEQTNASRRNNGIDQTISRYYG